MMRFNRYKCTCIFCGEEFNSGSPTGKVCKNPDCQSAYNEMRQRKQSEREKYRSRVRRPKSTNSQTGSLMEDVKKAAELGMTYGQYKAQH